MHLWVYGPCARGRRCHEPFRVERSLASVRVPLAGQRRTHLRCVSSGETRCRSGSLLRPVVPLQLLPRRPCVKRLQSLIVVALGRADRRVTEQVAHLSKRTPLSTYYEPATAFRTSSSTSASWSSLSLLPERRQGVAQTYWPGFIPQTNSLCRPLVKEDTQRKGFGMPGKGRTREISSQ